MSSKELTDFIKIGIFAGEAEYIASKTDDPDWKASLMKIAELCQNLIDERLTFLDRKQLLSVKRREQHSELLLYTSDQMRTHPLQQVEDTITVNGDDLYDLAELASRYCDQCPQGEGVKNCYYRKLYHRMGFPPARENVTCEQCEFRNNDEIVIEPPPMKQMAHYREDEGLDK